MINFINTCDLRFLKAFFGLHCPYRAQQWCAERGVHIEVSEELAQWMNENEVLVNNTWAEREDMASDSRNRTTPSTSQKRRVVKIAVLADGSHVEEVSWV